MQPYSFNNLHSVKLPTFDNLFDLAASDTPSVDTERKDSPLSKRISEQASPLSSEKRTSASQEEEGASPLKRKRVSTESNESSGCGAAATQTATSSLFSFTRPASAETFSRPSALARRGGLGARSKGPEWLNKSPLVIGGSIFQFNGSQYAIETIGLGEYHKVFRFTEEGTMQIGNTAYRLDSIVLKILNRGKVGPNKELGVITEDIKGYDLLVKKGVPVAKMFVNPTNVHDQHYSSNGKFWIVEKMQSPIDGTKWEGDVTFDSLDAEDKSILEWAKDWFTKMAIAKEEFINDFRIRNTMLNGEGKPHIVDYSTSDGDDFKYNLSRYLLDWSMKNAKIVEFLMKDFPEDLKKGVNEMLAEDLKP